MWGRKKQEPQIIEVIQKEAIVPDKEIESLFDELQRDIIEAINKKKMEFYMNVMRSEVDVVNVIESIVYDVLRRYKSKLKNG